MMQLHSGTDGEALLALDELFGAIDKYRTSQGFRQLLAFLERLPAVSPYNGLLIHIQRPGVTHVATLKGWAALGRVVKREAHPLVTLRAFGPVEFVYDVLDTTGSGLPPDVSHPFRTEGRLPADVLQRTMRHAEHDLIATAEADFGAQMAARVQWQPTNQETVLLRSGAPAALLVELSKVLSREAKYAALVHELAHVYCGHLGVPIGRWWPNRTEHLNETQREFEAEVVAWIVCTRRGLDPGSERYLEAYLARNSYVPDVSLNQMMVAANYIEVLGTARFRPRKSEERGGSRASGPLAQDAINIPRTPPVSSGVVSDEHSAP